MSSAERELLHRAAKPNVSDEMVGLFATGIEIVAAGDHQRW
ncbi:hypothetical protein ACNJX9_11245 [Bradyrhizobium sp. DASA03076]